MAPTRRRCPVRYLYMVAGDGLPANPDPKRETTALGHTASYQPPVGGPEFMSGPSGPLGVRRATLPGPQPLAVVVANSPGSVQLKLRRGAELSEYAGAHPGWRLLPLSHTSSLTQSPRCQEFVPANCTPHLSSFPPSSLSAEIFRSVQAHRGRFS